VTPEPPRCRLRRAIPVELPTLVRATDGGAPRRPTRIALCDDGERLAVRFECESPAPWATLTERDAPLWEEEVVEVFLAPGGERPTSYFELELNPLGTVFDARVAHPHEDRTGMVADAGWDCPGLTTRVVIDRPAAVWRAEMTIPWRSLLDGGEDPPAIWRLNLFRIDRPRPGNAEFSAWSPTFVRPADFHRPDRFGFVTRIE
jgi:hypothetical protein